MNSFKTVGGENIPFDSVTDLKLELQKDVASNEITAYLVEYEDNIYQISETTYDAIVKLKE